MHSSDRLRWLVMALIAGGMGGSVYLLVRTLQLLAKRADDSIPICTTLFGADCDETLLSPMSWQWSLPLAAWGAIYFAMLATLLILAWLLNEDFHREGTLAALLLAAAGVCASLALLVMLATGGAPFCPICVVVHGINLLLLPALWWQSGWNREELSNLLRGLVGDQPPEGRSFRWKVVGFLNVGLLAVVLYQWVLIEVAQHAEAGRRIDPQQVIAEFDAASTREIPIGPSDPQRGPADAPVQLVVFSDFQCRGCQLLAGHLAHFALDYPDELAVFYKHFPLGTVCNPAMTNDKHPMSCEAAYAAEAARRQGRFWEFHDTLFDSKWDTVNQQTLEQVAREVGLDLARFHKDASTSGVAFKVDADIALGNRLGVTSTPTVFLNGRELDDPSRGTLDVLINYVVNTKQNPGNHNQ